MNTKYTATWGWRAAKAVLYGLMFLVTYWITYALYNNGVYGVFNLCSMKDLNTWAIISAFVTWSVGGCMMFMGLVMDGLCALRDKVLSVIHQIEVKIRKA